ncbi:hypothetical protein Tco_1139701 [Tanacetum coccineum]
MQTTNTRSRRLAVRYEVQGGRQSLVRDGRQLVDTEVYYDTTNGVSAHYSETTSLLSAQIEYLDYEESDEDEPSKAEKSKINPLIREPSDALLMGDKEIKFNPLKDIDDLVPIPKVSEKPLDSLDPISKTFDMTIIMSHPQIHYSGRLDLGL